MYPNLLDFLQPRLRSHPPPLEDKSLIDAYHAGRYNIGIIAPLYVNQGFIKALHKPSAAQKGLITAIYYLGTWTSYVFLSGMASDKLGRRYAALTGALITCVGGAVQAGAGGKSALAMMVIGRIISGLGNAIISTSVPLYQRYVSLKVYKHRARVLV